MHELEEHVSHLSFKLREREHITVAVASAATFTTLAMRQIQNMV